MSATELVCAAPSQQRLRRSSVAAALRAASAPSQQHQLRRGRDAQNERDGAGLRSSVAAATPSQLCRSSAARTMSGRPGHCHTITAYDDHIKSVIPLPFRAIKEEYTVHL